MRLDHRRLEILVEEVADRHGPEADGLAHLALAHVMEAPAEEQELADVTGAQGHGIGRRAQQQWPDEPALAHDGVDVALVIVGVAPRVALHLAAQGVVLAIVGEVAAVGGEGGAALVGHHLQAETRQIEVAHDLGAQQAADIGAVGVGPARLELAADRGPADPGGLLDHQHLEPGLGQIAGRGQPVVPGADDDGVVPPAHGPPPPGLMMGGA